MSKQLEERFLGFALRVRNFCQQLKWNVISQEYIRQLVRCSGSVGANYIEASDDLGKQDERMKIKISRREAKESLYWLSLVLIHENAELEQEKLALIDEGTQIVRILSSILQKLETNAR